MALNPIVFTEKVVRSFLRYQLTAYPYCVVGRNCVIVTTDSRNWL